MWKGLCANHDPPASMSRTVRTIVAFGAVGAVVLKGDGDLPGMPWPDAREANLILAATTSSRPAGTDIDVLRHW